MSHRNPIKRAPGAWLAASAFLLAALVSGKSLADGPRGADWISSEAIAYLEVTSPSVLLDRWSGEPIRALLGSMPDYQKYLASDAYRDHRKVLDTVAEALGTTPERGLQDLVGGGLILAIEPGTPPRGVLIATPRDPALLARTPEAVAKLVRADAEARGQPDPVQTVEHRGVQAYRIGPKAAFAIVDGTLVVADAGETLRAIVDRSIDRQDPSKSLTGDPRWQSRRRAHRTGDPTAWGLVSLDRLRAINPGFLAIPERVNPLMTLLFAPWFESLRKAPWVSADLTWTSERLALSMTLPTPPEGYSNPLKRYLPTEGRGAIAPAMPPKTILSVALRRDLASLWEVRSDLFAPEVVQGFTQLDTFAGTFFGGRDFGTGVLGALGADWRLVIARQDAASLDPLPDDRLPAFALIADLRPDDEDFAIRLKSAFQSFVGLANLGGAQTKAPPLMLGSETVGGIVIATARYLRPRAGAKVDGPVPARHNFSPSAAQVGDRFLLSSAVGLVRDLIPALQGPAAPTDATLLAEVDGGELAALIEENRPGLVMKNMLQKGNDKPHAEAEVGFLARVVRMLGRGSLSARDTPGSVEFRAAFSTR